MDGTALFTTAAFYPHQPSSCACVLFIFSTWWPRPEVPLHACLTLSAPPPCSIQSGSTTAQGSWRAITPPLTASSTTSTSCWPPTLCRTWRRTSWTGCSRWAEVNQCSVSPSNRPHWQWPHSRLPLPSRWTSPQPPSCTVTPASTNWWR